MQYIASINDIDKEKALLLIDASIQAYESFSKEEPTGCQTEKITAPAGYDFIDYWTGVDSIFSKDIKTECYGLVFRSQMMPHVYVFAFRGTASFLDALDDLGVRKQKFVPYDNLSGVTVPDSVQVESGFYHVYSENDEKNGTMSMQVQLFALIDKYQESDKPIDQLYITGHSLGAALSELFTLDIALSRPEIVASNYNYACPRVGSSEFVDFYINQPRQQDIETRTLRIQNTYDKVPCVPPEEMGYQHVPYIFLIEFYEESWAGFEKYNLVARHSSANYQAVLQCAAESEDGVCVCKKLEVPVNNYAITSNLPDTKNICRFSQEFA